MFLTLYSVLQYCIRTCTLYSTVPGKQSYERINSYTQYFYRWQQSSNKFIPIEKTTNTKKIGPTISISKVFVLTKTYNNCLVSEATICLWECSWSCCQPPSQARRPVASGPRGGWSQPLSFPPLGHWNIMRSVSTQEKRPVASGPRGGWSQPLSFRPLGH